MKVRSKLADVEFRIGGFEYRKDHLVVFSTPEQGIPTRVYLSPDDIVTVLGRVLTTPVVWGYVLAFPFFLFRYRRRKGGATRDTE